MIRGWTGRRPSLPLLRAFCGTTRKTVILDGPPPPLLREVPKERRRSVFSVEPMSVIRQSGVSRSTFEPTSMFGVHLAREPDEPWPIQFSTFRPGTRLNSFVLLVTSVKPSCSA